MYADGSYTYKRQIETADAAARARGCQLPPFHPVVTFLVIFVGLVTLIGGFVEFMGGRGIEQWHISLYALPIAGAPALWFWRMAAEYGRIYYPVVEDQRVRRILLRDEVFGREGVGAVSEK